MAEQFYRRGLRRMRGRDIQEGHRAASSLELLFDLTFVAAFGVAGNQLAHGIAVGHGAGALWAFLIATAAIVWAWVNYSWFASAFDTDDWLFRLLTLVQMAGVVVLAIGMPQFFDSLDHGHFAGQTMTIGYVVMRVAMIAHWIRAAVSDPRYRSSAAFYALLVGGVQCVWVLIAFSHLETSLAWTLLAVTWLVEFTGPVLAERKAGSKGTPWHAHHIAERYSLLTIVTLGETVLGTLAAAQTITEVDGWSLDSIVIIAAGTAMSFAMWWAYFLLPSAPILTARRDKVYGWAYGHILIFAAVAAVGSGIHLVGYVYDEHYHVAPIVAISAIAVPVFVYLLVLFLVHAWLVSGALWSVAHAIMLLLPPVAIALAAAAVPLWVCFLVVLAAPLTVVVAYETWEHGPLSRQLDRALARAAARAQVSEGQD